ncbi:MAG: hypothetical protein AB1465_06875 [Patescibacteria group bacterium]
MSIIICLNFEYRFWAVPPCGTKIIALPFAKGERKKDWFIPLCGIALLGNAELQNRRAENNS